MGVNNRQRRAAKQRKRARRGPTPPRRPAGRAGGHDAFFGEEDPVALALGVVDMLLTRSVRRLARGRSDATAAVEHARSLRASLAPLQDEYLDLAVTDLLDRIVEAVVGAGWGPDDLGELVRRHGRTGALPVLAAILHAHAGRHAWASGSWRARLDELGPVNSVAVGTDEGLASCLAVAALLADLPPVPPTSTPPGARAATAKPAPTTDHRRLATVRALLAKAESTSYDEEAEALSAKAQELVSRYALERALQHTDGPEGRRGADAPVGARRLWLDPPYVRAKAQLVHEVALANRCRSAVVEQLGFCSLVGDPADLDAVELLVTSLLVQAGSAMLRHGRQLGPGGRSRTRSFRQAFLLAYAARIGERLRESDRQVARDADPTQRLLPALRDQEARVADAFAAMVPGAVETTTEISNGDGWAAGQVAADLALIDVHGKVTA